MSSGNIPSQPTKKQPITLVEKILDIARWAPSGDNTQPWRFEILGEKQFVVQGFDTREHCVYDLDGRPSQIAIGALLENIVIAAAEYGHEVEIRRRVEMPEDKPTFDILLQADVSIQKDRLFSCIPLRTTQRRSLSPRPLSRLEKQRLESAIAPFYRVLWLDGWENKRKAASLMFKNAKLRLTLPEAYEVHKAVIEWNASFSVDKMPDRAVGLDPLATRLMQWAMVSWGRVDFLNTYLAGTLLPRIQMDWLPGLFCGAHFALLAEAEPNGIDDFIAAGRVMQRFWLTATHLGLQMQPEMTPLIFSRYVRAGVDFSVLEKAGQTAGLLAVELEKLLGGSEPVTRMVFMGRIGVGKAARSRSLRLSLDDLMVRR